MGSGRRPSGGRTYRQIALDDYGVLMCDGRPCKKGWSFGIHLKGKVDSAGVVHLDRADNIPRRTGMRNFLMLVGWVLNDREWLKLPRWKRLYAVNVWAAKEARTRYHMTIRVEDTLIDRRKVIEAARRAGVVISNDRNVYMWTLRGVN